MITDLGSRSVAAVVPLFATSLATMKATVLGQLQGLAADVFALKGDLMALEADAAALAAELANATGLANGIAEQLAAGPVAALRGIEAAIAGILDGSTLLALKQAVLAGPAVVVVSLQSALAEVQARIAGYQGRIAGLAGRIAALGQRMKAVADRIAALDAVLAQLLQLQGFLATAGVHAFHYAGPVNAIAAELDGALAAVMGSGTDLAQCLVLVTTATSPWAVLSKVFGVRP